MYYNSAGTECYEVSNGRYLFQATEDGELSSCTLVDPTDTRDQDIVIPSKVGDYNITSIGPDCFTEEQLINHITSIVIEDDSITSIGDGVFKDLPVLKEVVIGNSVSSIGNQAFYNCPLLEDITFHTPKSGYEGFTIGTDAFKTGSNKLVMHGDIDTSYAPLPQYQSDGATPMRAVYSHQSVFSWYHPAWSNQKSPCPDTSFPSLSNRPGQQW